MAAFTATNGTLKNVTEIYTATKGNLKRIVDGYTVHNGTLKRLLVNVSSGRIEPFTEKRLMFSSSTPHSVVQFNDSGVIQHEKAGTALHLLAVYGYTANKIYFLTASSARSIMSANDQLLFSLGQPNAEDSLQVNRSWVASSLPIGSRDFNGNSAVRLADYMITSGKGASGAWSVTGAYQSLAEPIVKAGNPAFAANGTNAIFSGGSVNGAPAACTHCYSEQLVRHTLPDLIVPRERTSASSVNGNTVVAGGRNASGEALAVTDCYNKNMVKRSIPAIGHARYGHSVSTLGTYVVISGGAPEVMEIETFNQNLVREELGRLDFAQEQMYAIQTADLLILHSNPPPYAYLKAFKYIKSEEK